MNDPSPGPREWDAAAYHRLSSPQYGWGRKVLAELELCGDETVIDAGCGSGRLTAELALRLPRGRVIGIDGSENMIREANERLAPELASRVSFVRADLATFVADEPVDAVFSTATFHWIADHAKLFSNLFASLRPGGLVVAQCGGKRNLARVLARTEAIVAEPPYAPLFAGWPGAWHFEDDVTTLERLRQVGFVDVATWLEDAPTPFATGAELGEFLGSVVLCAYLARIPDARLRTRLIDRLLEQAARDEPPYVLDYVRLDLRARRPRAERGP